MRVNAVVYCSELGLLENLLLMNHLPHIFFVHKRSLDHEARHRGGVLVDDLVTHIPPGMAES